MDSVEIEARLTEISSFQASSAAEVEEFRVRFLGKKGVLRELFAKLKEADASSKRELGLLINKVKESAEQKITALSNSGSDEDSLFEDLDPTLPGSTHHLGTRHPISIVKNRMCEIFERIGFKISEGPEIETDWYNFSALNIPVDHPARDMQDTFFLQTDPDILLRTHTSPQQIRVMESTEPPIRIICPGRVYRNETISARAHCIFHQIEGLYIDENVSFADLKHTLFHFTKEMFGEETKTRFRPSYFPFTEPSAEMDISCLICKGKGCSVCKNSGWVEILGCGMVDPTVLENCKIDSKKYAGFAFGLGVERPAMLTYRINDIRLFFENDIRFLKQFQSA